MSRCKRKTAAESRAQSFASGFDRAVRIIEIEWRKQIRQGLVLRDPDLIRSGGEELWAVIKKLQTYRGLYEDDYLSLGIPRTCNRSFERLRRRVKLTKPHPHAGQKGFVLDSPTFEHENSGMWRVWFLSQSRSGIDNCFARPSQWKWLDPKIIKS